MTAATALLAGVLGLLVGHLVGRAAGGFPWPPRKRSWRQLLVVATAGATHGSHVHPPVTATSPVGQRSRPSPVRLPLVECTTAALFATVGIRFGLSWELPAFLVASAAGVLLAVIDLQHRLLPDRVIVPAAAIGLILLTVAALGDGSWSALGRAVAASAVLFAVHLGMALVSPAGLGMGDVKLAGLIGLHLGWLGWTTVVVGAAAGFVVQAVLALGLLTARRIEWRGELPFGPAMLVGAALAVGWSDALLG